MRAFCFVLLPAISVTLFTARPKDVSVKTIEAIKRSIVPIVCGFPDAGGNFIVVSIVGSGFLVNKNGDFLTAAHVLGDWQRVSTPQVPCFPTIYIPIGGWKKRREQFQARWFKFLSCVADEQVDVAACHTINNPFTDSAIEAQITPVKFGKAEESDGTPVAFTGFPLNSLVPITSKGFIASHREISNQGQAGEIMIDKDAWPGASGSPVYIASGLVIGVIRKRGIGEGVGLAYARTANRIVAFLQARGIPVTR